MKVPFFDLSRQYSNIKKDILSDVESFFESNAFSSGKYVDQFEIEFANFNNIKSAVGVSSGVAALHLALLALDVGKGDEVIVPVNTFISTANAVVYTGAKPVFVDIDEHTWNIDISKIEAAINNKTKAIIVVHLYGSPVDMKAIKLLAHKYKLKIIEDTAQAHGALLGERKVGTFGDIGCFSFYPSKNLGAYGEGGAIVLNDSNLATYLKSLRSCGKVGEAFPYIGYNYRMHGFQGFVLSKKIKYLESWNNKRREIGNQYLAKITNPKFQFQKILESAVSVYHLFVVQVENRAAFIEYLEEKDIGYGIHYQTPLHLEKAYSFLGHKRWDFTVGESHANKCISLPLFPEMTDEEVNYVIDVVNDF